MIANNGFKAVAPRLRKFLDGRRYLVSAGLGLLVAPLISLGRTPQPWAPQAGRHSSSGRVLTARDITYLGAVRMPNGVDTNYAYGGMTGRMVNGHVRLFIYGTHVGSGVIDGVYEIEDPGSGYSANIGTAPQASLITNWGDVYHGKRMSWDASGNPFNVSYVSPASLAWNDATQLLYWTYFHSYNVSHEPDWGLGATSLDNPTTGASTSYGPWRTVATDGDGRKFYGPWRCLYPFTNPMDGSMLCGSTTQSGNSGSPFGPDAYGGRAWPTKTSPGGFSAPDIPLPDRFLEYYFMGDPTAPNHIGQDGRVQGHLRSFRRTTEQALYENQGLRANPALNNGVGSWAENDGTSGAIWLELDHTRGVIFSALLAGAVSQDPTDCVNAAHEWYTNAAVNPPIGACSHGCRPPSWAPTGPVTTKSFPAFIIYNPDDLLAVKAGAKTDYTVDPTSTIDLIQTYDVTTALQSRQGAARSLTGFYFDPVRKYLFTVSVQADESAGRYFVQSLIHVFAIKDTPTGS